ncbi:transposase [Streptomyces cirratus]|uniref:transposase n=1 Tax=Streptomyces cirratus TaxID=68187 RepID=UPI00357096AB
MTTKIHLACDGRGRPLAVLLTPGQRHDGVCARPLLERIRIPRTGPGRPRCRPDHVIADKAYSSRGFRACLRRRGIGHTIPEKNDQKQHRRNRGGEAVGPQASTVRPTAAATPSNAASTASKASAASPPPTRKPPPPTKQRAHSHHFCSGQDRFEDGP